MVNKWALLCGGDFYLPPNPAKDKNGNPHPAPRNLKGCVKDVEAIREVLINSGMASENIVTLTATCGLSRELPIEKRQHWPTWKNIKRELNQIAEKANREDLVYFHFSGHGTMRKDIKEDPKQKGGIQSGTALVMTDVYRNGPYLTGHHLGTFVKDMVTNKSLRVTVVLDSCHSGAAFRDSDEGYEEVRHLEALPTRQVDVDADVDADAKCGADGSESDRDPESVRPCWFSNPTGCTILTACNSQQVAAEREFSKRVHGVLTYHLVELLKSSGSRPPSHKRIVEYVQRENKGRKQTPSAHGDVFFEFFGNCEHSTGETCNATFPDKQRIELNIGRAQGVAIGAQYDIYPEGSPEAEELPVIKAKVTDVFNFRSWAEPIQKRDVPNWPSDEIRYARLTQWALGRPVYVRAPSIQAEKLHDLERQLGRTPGLGLRVDHHHQQNGDLVVSIGKRDMYEVRQKDKILPRLPKISVQDKSWAAKLAQVLSHVARYQDLRRQFTTGATDPRLGQFSLTATPNEVESGDEVEFTLSYKGNEPLSKLCVSLYCFSDSWAIHKLHPGPGLAADWNFWDQYEDEGITVKMRFPAKVNGSDPDEMKDLFVFFVATANRSGTPSWGDISLPSLQHAFRTTRKWHAPKEDEGQRHDVCEPREKEPMWTAVQTSVRITPG